MRIKLGIGLLMLAMVVVPLADTRAQEVSDNGITQGELAVMVVNLLGWSASMPAAPTTLDYIALLNANGIAPLDGWQPGELVVLADLVVVLVQALELEDQVEDPDNPESYVELLESLGVSFENIGVAMDNIGVRGGELLEPIAYGDPLREPPMIESVTLILRSQRGVTLPEVVEVIDELPAVPRRPRRPTPD